MTHLADRHCYPWNCQAWNLNGVAWPMLPLLKWCTKWWWKSTMRPIFEASLVNLKVVAWTIHFPSSLFTKDHKHTQSIKQQCILLYSLSSNEVRWSNDEGWMKTGLNRHFCRDNWPVLVASFLFCISGFQLSMQYLSFDWIINNKVDIIQHSHANRIEARGWLGDFFANGNYIDERASQPMENDSNYRHMQLS